jgi:hypothetical protein
MRRLALAIGLLACSGQQNQVNAANAAITAGAAVAAAAIVREALHECWGYYCPTGLVCDEDSGLCVEPPELTARAQPRTDDEREAAGCVQEEDGRWVCPDDPETEAEPESGAKPEKEP